MAHVPPTQLTKHALPKSSMVIITEQCFPILHFSFAHQIEPQGSDGRYLIPHAALRGTQQVGVVMPGAHLPTPESMYTRIAEEDDEWP
jgi:hypothetical protein